MGSPVPSLTIGIAATPDDRRRLARLLGETDAFLIVSSVDQARAFLDAVEASPEALPSQVVVASAEPALRVDSDRRMLTFADREVGLTPLEHDFLHCLVGSPGQIWTYKRLHLEVWGNEHLGRGSDLHSVVRRVRRKLAWLGTTARIHSVRGVGFRFAA